MTTSADMGRTWHVQPEVAPASECFGITGAGPHGFFMGTTALATTSAPLELLRSTDDGAHWLAVRVGQTTIPSAIPPFTETDQVSGDPPINAYFPALTVADGGGPTFVAASTADRTGRHFRLLMAAPKGRFANDLAPIAPPSATCAQQMLDPVVASIPAGGVAVQFICHSATRAGEGLRQVWATASVDGGRSWLTPLLLDERTASSCNEAPGYPLTTGADCMRYTDGVDFWSFTTTGRDVLAMWTDAVGGRQRLMEQQLRIG